MASVIIAENISKRYFVTGPQRNSYSTLRDNLAAIPRALWSRFLGGTQSRQSADDDNTFWALKDISFQVEAGDVLGIVGRNGAGKSTLLKVLSRITPPTEGRAKVAGRVASLLEVGTGFHPELTGRENVFLNGSIMGMSRAEITRKFDSIVDFSETERFIDTPVKRYSSGMYVRLAFAVAAHLDPDILIIDEILAVGDPGFRQKCLGQIDKLGKSDRTVIFVSHDLHLIRTLCTRGILIHEGRIAMDGKTEDVLAAFVKKLQNSSGIQSEALAERRRRTSGAVCIDRVALLDDTGHERWSYQAGETVRMRIEYEAHAPVSGLGVYCEIDTGLTQQPLTSIKHAVSNQEFKRGDKGAIEVVFPNTPLRGGDYTFYIIIGDEQCNRCYDVIDRSVSLPLFSIVSEERDTHLTYGCFSIPSRVEWKPEDARMTA